ncbi:trypsin-like peptidase domain-containing protein [bacterium]|nr:trypsin-like peptidase domain-containing protein [bacterium]
MSGIAGVFVGALLVLSILYYSGALNHKATDISSAQTTVEQRDDSKNTDTEDKEKAKDSTIKYNSSPSPMPVGSNIVADAVAKVAPAVVNIDTATLAKTYSTDIFGFSDPFDYQIQEIPRGMGTGVIISKDGIVLTNNHVVNKAQSIRVTLSDKTKYKAVPIGTDPISDLAILKIEDPKGDLPTATLTSSENMRIGDWVIALGNPLGVGQTATIGVLSAKNRSLIDSNIDLRNLLQTDAAINPGNSGGPLVNMNGEVIGINTAIIRSAQGIGFAIPSETIRTVVDDLRANGHVTRPYLGIQMSELSPNARAYLGIDKNVQGIIVGRVEANSPASKAGIKNSDIIVAIDGKETKDVREIQSIIRSKKVGDKVNIKLLRNEETKEILVTLEEMPSRFIRSQR